jgi:hypothetical protein
MSIKRQSKDGNLKKFMDYSAPIDENLKEKKSPKREKIVLKSK